MFVVGAFVLWLGLIGASVSENNKDKIEQAGKIKQVYPAIIEEDRCDECLNQINKGEENE